MVLQGTVSGPPLRNRYYADAGGAVQKHGFIGTVFADDLNCFEISDARRGNIYLLSEVRQGGHANHVVFEPSKDSSHILDRRRPYGKS